MMRDRARATAHVQYAVIQVRQSDGGIERFAIAYHDERVLREFLAKPCIVASGFSSRDEATKSSFKPENGRRAALESHDSGQGTRTGFSMASRDFWAENFNETEAFESCSE